MDYYLLLSIALFTASFNEDKNVLSEDFLILLIIDLLLWNFGPEIDQ
jgi:hypothetical protein